MLIVDAHQDLAWNMLTFGRDYARSALETRQLERGTFVPIENDDCLLGWPEYQRGRVAVVFGTIFAAPIRWRTGKWDTQCYEDTRQARRLYLAQLEAYEELCDRHAEKFCLINDRKILHKVLADWEQDGEHEPSEEERLTGQGYPVGLVVLMEGAECISEVDELEEWWGRGVRLIGPAWAGTRFCGGTKEPGPLTSEGYALLEGMASFGFCLDISHMDEKAALQALDMYAGQVIASHSNALALLKGSDSNRHLSDRLIQGILERDGAIGIVPYNGFLKEGWKRGDRRDEVGLQDVVAHIDYICQMAGNAKHVGIGSDFDGGFGLQSVPVGIDTIADLHKLTPLLLEKGYSMTDVTAILGGNWLDRLERILPEDL